MVRDGINVYLIWMIRIILGLAVALLLAVVGDISARVFNLLLGYPWHPYVHQNIQVIGIGLGAGIASYLAWPNFSFTKRWIAGTLFLIFIGAVLGAYIGDIYGPGPEPTYWWSRFATDKVVYLSAALGGMTVSVLLGLFRELR